MCFKYSDVSCGLFNFCWPNAESILMLVSLAPISSCRSRAISARSPGGMAEHFSGVPRHVPDRLVVNFRFQSTLTIQGRWMEALPPRASPRRRQTLSTRHGELPPALSVRGRALVTQVDGGGVVRGGTTSLSRRGGRHVAPRPD